MHFSTFAILFLSSCTVLALAQSDEWIGEELGARDYYNDDDVFDARELFDEDLDVYARSFEQASLYARYLDQPEARDMFELDEEIEARARRANKGNIHGKLLIQTIKAEEEDPPSLYATSTSPSSHEGGMSKVVKIEPISPTLPAGPPPPNAFRSSGGH